MRKPHLILLVLLVPAIACAQGTDQSDSDFGISLGLSNYQVREEVLNNLRHSGTLFSLGLSHTRPTGLSLKTCRFNVTVSTMKSRYESESNSYALNTVLTYSYSRRVARLTDKADLYVGGIIGLNQHLDFYDAWDESHIYWLTAYFLGPAGLMTYRKSEKSSFSIDVNLPLVSVVSRPPERFLYKEGDPTFSWIMGRIHDNLRLTSIHRHFAFDVTLGYTHGSVGGTKRFLFWRMTYLHNSMEYSKEISIATHTVGVALLF